MTTPPVRSSRQAVTRRLTAFVSMSREQVDIELETSGPDPRAEWAVEAGVGKYKVQPLEEMRVPPGLLQNYALTKK